MVDIEPKKIVMGEFRDVTENQEKLAQKCGGWRQKYLRGLNIPVLWNSTVSPPFAGLPYKLADRTLSKLDFFALTTPVHQEECTTCGGNTWVKRNLVVVEGALFSTNYKECPACQKPEFKTRRKNDVPSTDRG